jgi:hypothetical protein
VVVSEKDRLISLFTNKRLNWRDFESLSVNTGYNLSSLGYNKEQNPSNKYSISFGSSISQPRNMSNSVQNTPMHGSKEGMHTLSFDWFPKILLFQHLISPLDKNRSMTQTNTLARIPEFDVGSNIYGRISVETKYFWPAIISKYDRRRNQYLCNFYGFVDKKWAWCSELDIKPLHHYSIHELMKVEPDRALPFLHAMKVMEDQLKKILFRISSINQDICHVCGTGGHLICCDNCPNSSHALCSGYEKDYVNKMKNLTTNMTCCNWKISKTTL